jgi:hypothetical protein
MREFLPIPLTGQFGEEVLFINSLAPAKHLREAALRRLTAVEDLLQLLEVDHDSSLICATARLASALAPLVSEARQLYELALERPGYQAGAWER